MAISIEQNIKNAFIRIKWEPTKKRNLQNTVVDTLVIPNVALSPLTMHRKWCKIIFGFVSGFGWRTHKEVIEWSGDVTQFSVAFASIWFIQQAFLAPSDYVKGHCACCFCFYSKYIQWNLSKSIKIALHQILLAADDVIERTFAILFMLNFIAWDEMLIQLLHYIYGGVIISNGFSALETGKLLPFRLRLMKRAPTIQSE